MPIRTRLVLVHEEPMRCERKVRRRGLTSLLFVHAIMKVKKGGCQRDPYIGGVSRASVVYDGVVLVYCLPPMLCGWPRPIGGRP